MIVGGNVYGNAVAGTLSSGFALPNAVALVAVNNGNSITVGGIPFDVAIVADAPSRR
jgi:hypothetical protein